MELLVESLMVASSCRQANSVLCVVIGIVAIKALHARQR